MPARSALLEDVPSGIRKARASIYLYRAGAAHVFAHVNGSTPLRSAEQLFKGDVVTAEIIRAATTQATVGTPAWAGALAQQAIDDSIMAVATLSAASGLIDRGMKVSFDRRASIRIPGRLLDSSDAGAWLGEGQPVPVRIQRLTAGPTLTPHKLVVVVTFTREMAEHSAIERVSRALIGEATALALDKTLFGSQPDDGVTPLGILNGVTPITPATGGGAAAMATDIGKLVSALVAANAGRDPTLIMNPVQATTLSLLASPRFKIPILQSSSVPVGTVIAVESSSFVSAFDAVPEFDTADQMAIHMDDTAPANPIMSGQPMKSLWQVDSIALRMRVKASWGMRASGHVQVVNSCTW